MYKRILIALSIFFISMPNVFGASFYVVPVLDYVRLQSGENSPIHFYGMGARISIGYGDFVKDIFYLAGEFVVVPFAPLTLNNVQQEPANLKYSYSYGINILPGVLLDYYVKAFAILGVMQTHFENLSTRTGYQLGGGLDYWLESSWSARVEYIYTRYNAISGVGTLTQDTIGVGLVYRFC